MSAELPRTLTGRKWAFPHAEPQKQTTAATRPGRLLRQRIMSGRWRQHIPNSREVQRRRPRSRRASHQPHIVDLPNMALSRGSGRSAQAHGCQPVRVRHANEAATPWHAPVSQGQLDSAWARLAWRQRMRGRRIDQCHSAPPVAWSNRCAECLARRPAGRTDPPRTRAPR